MNKPLQKLRRFFARTKKLNATANPDALSAAYDDDDGASRLSGAFVIVLLLHIVALVGVFAASRLKDRPLPPAETPAAAAAKAAPAAPQAKPPVAAKQPAAPVAAVNPNNVAAISVPQETRLAPVESPRPVLGKGERLHVVKAGDNLTKIAVGYNVTVAEVVKLNGLKVENDLRIGQELRIPEAAKTAAKTPTPRPAATEPGTYTVKKNDSLIKIANTLGVKYADLVKLNNIKDPKKLQEGQKLKVPKKG